VGESGGFDLIFTALNGTELKKPRYIGEFECKLDDKGRVVIPAGLKKQLPKESLERMVVNRGFEKCLTFYTRKDWDDELMGIGHLNHFNRKHRMFIRQFSKGATELQVDKASRVLLPKQLVEYAGLESELVFYAYGNRIEIWSKKRFDEMMAMDADEYSDLAEEVMGDLNGEEGVDD
jgi:MraZ protein